MTAVTLRKRSKGDTGPIVYLMKCGHCTSGHHSSCRARMRNGWHVAAGGAQVRKFVDCSCCGDKTPRRCLDCGNGNLDEVDEQHHECVDKGVCAGRQELRRISNPLYQMLQQIKSDAAVERRRKKIERLRLLGLLPADEEPDIEALERKGRPRRTRVVRPTSGSCIHCGEPTRGGSFLPGHDAKYKSELRARAKDGDQQAAEILVQRGWA